MSGHRTLVVLSSLMIAAALPVVTGAFAQSTPTTTTTTTKPTTTAATTKPTTTVAATTTATTPPKPTPVKLAAADIQSMFGTGTAFAASNVGGQTYSYVLKPDGTASRTPKGSKTAETGTWRAADPGYCATWGKGGSEHCYSIAKATTGTAYDVMDTANKVIAHWTPAKT